LARPSEGAGGRCFVSGPTASGALATPAQVWERCLALARRGVGRTAPNPPVGAVVVRDHAVVGEGHHQRAGGPHAEPIALDAAGDRAVGADLYVSLEPCPHHGRTPPCTEAILRAGVRRVYYGTEDPNPRVRGAGVRRLTEAGVECHRAPARVAARAEELIRFYARHVTTGLPYVLYKYAMSLDGAVAAGPGQPVHLTGLAADREVHRLRDRLDAVLIGVGTALADDPRLTARRPGGRDPLRVVVDTNLRLWPGARVLDPASGGGCLVVCRAPAPTARAHALRQRGAEVVEIPSEGAGVDLEATLRHLGQRGLVSVLLEGGPRLAAAMLAQGLVQEVWAYLTPRIVGRADGAGAVRAAGAAALPGVTSLQAVRVGGDLRIRAMIGPSVTV
jgi:diaminohydroxyphosphoribosylaminopyrimidine deaminase/5-amino-6-(5-phosphoribosylamino)uracil reductase